MTLDSRTRWYALIVLCLGSLMIVLDTTIVNVALPSIRSDLGFSSTSLAWVVNAYLLTFGGFLLLGGRLGDLYGHRRLFLAGITLFTAASLACGLANSQEFLIAARAVQGLGGAVASAVSLSLMMTLFTEPGDRAKAMGVFGFVASGGGSIGVLLGGVLTDTLDWHWIFLVNLPIGLAVVLLSLRLLPGRTGEAGSGRLDVAGAVTVTASLMLAVYAIVNGNQNGWTSARTLGLLATAAALLVLFLVVESRVSAPLMPLRVLRLRNVAIANIVGVLWAASMFAWFFLSALYLQLVLGYSPLQVGLAFLPSNIIMGILSVAVSARLVMRFGIKPPLAAGLLLAGTGLALFARAPVDGTFVFDVLPSMVLLGLGAGIGPGQYRIPHGRRAGPGRARKPCRLAHRHAERFGRRPPRRTRRRLPRGVRRRRHLRCDGCRDRRVPAAPRTSAGRRARRRTGERVARGRLVTAAAFRGAS
jgi:EmrB/QacA subfamily drug resistance transporter